jgi:hypothetical protein
MNTPRYAAAAAKLITRHLPKVTVELVERERSIATIERAILARSRRRRWLGVGGALAVAATLLLAAQVARLRAGSEPTLSRVSIKVSPSGQGAALQAGDVGLPPVPVMPRAALEAGQRIETPADGGAALQFSTGTSVSLAGSTTFRVDSQGDIEHFPCGAVSWPPTSPS